MPFELPPGLEDHIDAPGTIGDVVHQLARALAESKGQAALEVGVRAGGTSALMCVLAASRPDFLVIGVDPYGNAPYWERGRDTSGALDYGDEHYARARALLAHFSNHALFRMDADTFLAGVLPRYSWWSLGRRFPDHERFVAFAFLDGPHDDASVCREALLVLPFLAPAARLCIDNVGLCPGAVALLDGLPELERITLGNDRACFRRRG